MSSTCTIRARAEGESTTDPETGAVTPAKGAVVYSGPCRVRPAGSNGGTQADVREAAGAEVFAFDYLVTVPFSVTTVIEAMTCRIDSSPDPAIVGRDLQIEQVARGDHITARRLSCKEVS